MRRMAQIQKDSEGLKMSPKMLGIFSLSKEFSFYHKCVQIIKFLHSTYKCNVILLHTYVLCITTHFDPVISVKQYDLGCEIVTIFVVDINVIKS